MESLAVDPLNNNNKHLKSESYDNVPRNNDFHLEFRILIDYQVEYENTLIFKHTIIHTYTYITQISKDYTSVK